jgi:hypothetical protein
MKDGFEKRNNLILKNLLLYTQKQNLSTPLEIYALYRPYY